MFAAIYFIVLCIVADILAIFSYGLGAFVMSVGICPLLLLLLPTIVKSPKIAGTLIAVAVLAGLAVLCFYK